MKTEKLKTYYLIIGMVCLCFLTASVGFTFYSMEEYEKKDISHFKENVESMRNSVSNMIKGNIEILDGITESCREEKTYHMTTKPDQPAMLPQGFIYGTAAEACMDTK